MSTLLKTERLTLRASAEEDLPALVPLLNDFDITKNLTPVPFPYTMEAARGRMRHGSPANASR